MKNKHTLLLARICLSGIPKRFLLTHGRFEELLSNLPSFRPSGIYLWGPVGVGKTHKAVQMMYSHAITSPEKMLFVSVPNLLSEIRNSFGKDYVGESSHELVKKYSNVHLLTLDDLGAEKTTDWVLQTLYTIINNRYNDVLPTIITSNYSLRELSNKIGDRITSRISEMCEVMKVNGRDRRQK